MLTSSDVMTIKTIVDSGSISKAADILNVTQSTLSKRLARLEQVLKVSLFYRHNGGMKATPIATYLVESGERIQESLDSMFRHVEMLSELQGGSLHIGVGPIIEQLYFPDVLLDFIHETSNVKIRMYTETEERLVQMLRSGQIDIAIGPFNPQELEEDFIVSPVQSAKLVAIAHPDHPLLDDAPEHLPLSVLKEYPTVGPEPSTTVLKLLRAAKIEAFDATITCDSYSTAKSIVQKSNYLTCGPEALFKAEIDEASLAELPINLNIEWQSFFAVRPESIELPVVKKFTEVFNRLV